MEVVSHLNNKSCPCWRMFFPLHKNFINMQIWLCCTHRSNYAIIIKPIKDNDNEQVLVFYELKGAGLGLVWVWWSSLVSVWRCVWQQQQARWWYCPFRFCSAAAASLLPCAVLTSSLCASQLLSLIIYSLPPLRLFLSLTLFVSSPPLLVLLLLLILISLSLPPSLHLNLSVDW